MTKQQALEEVRDTVSKFNNFLNDTDPKHAINVIEPVNAGYTLDKLANTCMEVLSWIDEQTKMELERARELDRREDEEKSK